jgi:Protein of unknown function (DUF2892).
MFAKNVGSMDRIIRIIVGIVLLSLFFVYPESPWRYAALIGIVPLVTGLSRPARSIPFSGSRPAR